MNIGTIISAVLSLLASLIMLGVTRKMSMRDKEQLERDDAQTKERLLQTKMIAATMKLSEATAIAARDGRTNGEMKAAMTECAEAKKAYYEFLDEQAFKHIN